MLHETGAVGFRDEYQAIEWYRRAAGQSHTAAEASLGRLFASGSHAERDMTQAVHFFQRAAAKVRESRANMVVSTSTTQLRLTLGVRVRVWTHRTMRARSDVSVECSRKATA